MFHVRFPYLDDVALAWEALLRRSPRTAASPGPGVTLAPPAPVLPASSSAPLPPPPIAPPPIAPAPIAPPPIAPAPIAPAPTRWRDPSVTQSVMVRLGLVLLVVVGAWCYAFGNVFERLVTDEPEPATVVRLDEEGGRRRTEYAVTVAFADGRETSMDVRASEYAAVETGEQVTVTVSAISGRPVRIDGPDWSSRGSADDWTVSAALVSVLLVAAMAFVWFRVVPYVAPDQRARVRRLTVAGLAGVVAVAALAVSVWMLIERQRVGS